MDTLVEKTSGGLLGAMDVLKPYKEKKPKNLGVGDLKGERRWRVCGKVFGEGVSFGMGFGGKRGKKEVC